MCERKVEKVTMEGPWTTEKKSEGGGLKGCCLKVRNRRTARRVNGGLIMSIG